MLASLAGCKRFSKIDLSRAYLQLNLDSESRQYTTLNTHKGLFRFTRLPFGVASASAIFQRTIEGVLRGIEHVLVRADDILVSGLDDDEHFRNLREVLECLHRAGLRVKREKCSFYQPSVVYMEYLVDEEGHRPISERIRGVLNALEPTPLPELRSYLRMVNYYAQFLPSLATVLEPLHVLLGKGAQWNWTERQARAFNFNTLNICCVQQTS